MYTILLLAEFSLFSRSIYEKKGVEVVILYNKNAEESLQDLIKLHPEIKQFNFQPA